MPMQAIDSPKINGLVQPYNILIESLSNINFIDVKDKNDVLKTITILENLE